MAKEDQPEIVAKGDAQTQARAADDRRTAQIIKFTGFGPENDKLPASAIQSNAVEIDDEFQNFYLGSKASKDIIVPPFNPKVLRGLCQTNNALQPCVDAMVTNIEGTGFEFIKDNTKPEDQDSDPNIKKLWDFFQEPWPGMNFVAIRKQLREDREQTGNAYLEVIRNAQDDPVFIRPMESVMTRMVKLDAPHAALRKVTRGGVEASVRVALRERRFAMLIGTTQVIYFKEFGATRDLDKYTGEWASGRLPAKRRASEVIHFKALDDVNTPYGVPRWISQMPSVLGSRKAEEFNLEFFDNGGVPPVMILLQGGVLAAQTRDAINKQNAAPAKAKNRIMTIEAEPTGGGLDSPGTTRVTVERFGSERQQDSMFENYDKTCEGRIRRSFRLPPIFVGGADDYSFATAYTSYTVAEAQVFKPEREEFDEIISSKLIPALFPELGKTYRMRSLTMNIEDATIRLKAAQLAWETGHADPQALMQEINESGGTNIKYTEEWQDPKGQERVAALTSVPTSTEIGGGPAKSKTGAPANNPVNRS